MTFLSPWVAAGIAAVVVPALVLLYFLKLRRREEPISSTFLWKRAVQDLQVNAPFQRLRRNLLLLLQLLVLAGAILALARPMIETTVPDEASLILLIDHSASMNTREEDCTRLELAKEQAVGLVRQLNRTGSSWFSFGSDTPQTRVMVIEFAERASVVAPFTTNTTDLVDVIENIEPTDAPTNLHEALTLAEAYVDPDEVQQGSKAILFSDGRVADLDQVRLRYGALEYIPIGETRDNVGITALRVQRNYEQPELVSVFMQVQNFGSEPVTTDISLFIDNRLQRVQEVRLAAGEVDTPTTSPADAAPQAVTGTAPPGSCVPLS
ncbi:MAG: BatA and WFA domain-containing protein, partial [Phycisphaerae bacterium]|nr:BatA and WFA domain-containing protein [Phycisphaerae bacterium]